MTLWLVRTGRQGEREDFDLHNKVAVIGWDPVGDLASLRERPELTDLLRKAYPEEKSNTLKKWESELWSFAHEIKPGDLIVFPPKHRSVMVIGEVSEAYRFIKDNPVGMKHTRSVKSWQEFPRNQFDQDLLYSFGALLTVCRVQRNQAEERVRALVTGKKVTPN